MTNILWFNQVRKKDISKVGGKGANLGEMTKAGFPVPSGFAVTAQAYFEFVKSTGIQDILVEMIDKIDVENTDQLQKTTEKARQLILDTDMNEELKGDILKAYIKLGEEKVGWLSSSTIGFVAVRSSATAEDLPDASFAGQQETFLNVKGKEELITYVKRCWASLFTARATYYRKKQGFNTNTVGISVIVQKMVDSKVSGIMFTADPTGDENKIIIEGGFGLGEAIVSGSVTPDTYIIDKNTMKVTAKTINRQEFKIVRKGKGNEEIKLDEETAKKQKLSEDLILKIAKVGKKIEKHYDHPQDIEWAVENGKVFIVQSRAITTLGLKDKVEKDKALREQIEKADTKTILKGLPASPGVISGKVKIAPTLNDIAKIQEGDILVTKMTSPDWVPIMRKSKAIITNEGGTVCHAAIVSRELGIPCVVGSMKATEVLKDGDEVTVNGYSGEVYEGEVKIDLPDEKEETKLVIENPEELKKAVTQIPEFDKSIVDAEDKEAIKQRENRRRILEEKNKFAKVKDSHEDIIEILKSISAKVKVNVALSEAAERAAKTQADGVGLLRAEHMITASGMHPAEFLRQGKNQELVKVIKDGIRSVAEKFKGKPVWYRTFDARTDEFRGLKGGEEEPHEDNPMIGWHGIRRDLDSPQLLKAQFQAIKELRAEGYTNVGVMLPFVIHIEEVREAKKIAKEIGLDPDNNAPEFGVMIETPASVWIIEDLVKEISFVSFGTNDLTQLSLGLDRNNERVQKRFSEEHPAILGQIAKVIKVCRKEGVVTSICGQAASKPEIVRKLVRMGIGSLSANIDAVQKIRKVVIEEEKTMILESIADK